MSEIETIGLVDHGERSIGRPADPRALGALVHALLGVRVGRGGPLEYLWHALDDRPVSEGGSEARDSVVWACRGGGKTYLGALATTLDMLMNPGIQVRIVAGSLQQAGHMHAHLCGMFASERLGPWVKGRITATRLQLANGSRVELLAQSQRAVRGTRVHRLRCDEVELFDPAIWEAAQMVTRSKDLGGRTVRASIEALSTMHVPFGLMHEIVNRADERGRRVFKWGIDAVLGACACAGEAERDACPIGEICEERSASLREGRIGPEDEGFFHASDALAMMRRVTRSVWEEEMLCVRPSRRDSVFPEFDLAAHVVHEAPGWSESARWVCGMDFGIRTSALLWAAIDHASGTVYVVDERVMENRVLGDQIEAIRSSGWPEPEWVGVDPAGGQRSRQSGATDIDVLRGAGLGVRDRRLGVEAGISLVRARLRDAAGRVRLVVDGRCERLIASLGSLHYDMRRRDKPEPVKDGHDHIADALRYLVVNLDQGYRAETGRWA